MSPTYLVQSIHYPISAFICSFRSRCFDDYSLIQKQAVLFICIIVYIRIFNSWIRKRNLNLERHLHTTFHLEAFDLCQFSHRVINNITHTSWFLFVRYICEMMGLNLLTDLHNSWGNKFSTGYVPLSAPLVMLALVRMWCCKYDTLNYICCNVNYYKCTDVSYHSCIFPTS